MPRAFNAHEERKIRGDLRNHGRKLFSQYGVSKTSIEDLTNAAGIAKGSFYKFFASKETLFFELLEDAQNEIRSPLLGVSSQKSLHSRKHFEQELRSMIAAIRQEPLVMLMGNPAEIQIVARKVSPDVLLRHQERDQKFITSVIDHWSQKKKKPPVDMVAAHISLLLLIQYNDTILGDRLYPYAEDAVITNFANCFFS